jgi:hypothetical protein
MVTIDRYFTTEEFKLLLAFQARRPSEDGQELRHLPTLPEPSPAAT